MVEEAVEAEKKREYENSNLGLILKDTANEKLIESKRYMYQEFNNFNQNQRNKIMDLHKQCKKNASSEPSSSSNMVSV